MLVPVNLFYMKNSKILGWLLVLTFIVYSFRYAFCCAGSLMKIEREQERFLFRVLKNSKPAFFVSIKRPFTVT